MFLAFLFSLRYLMRELKQVYFEVRKSSHENWWKRLQSGLTSHFLGDAWNVIDATAFMAQLVTDILVIFCRSQHSFVIGE